MNFLKAKIMGYGLVILEEDSIFNTYNFVETKSNITLANLVLDKRRGIFDITVFSSIDVANELTKLNLVLEKVGVTETMKNYTGYTDTLEGAIHCTSTLLLLLSELARLNEETVNDLGDTPHILGLFKISERGTYGLEICAFCKPLELILDLRQCDMELEMIVKELRQHQVPIFATALMNVKHSWDLTVEDCKKLFDGADK